MNIAGRVVLERIYPRLGVSSQNLLISVYGMAYRRRRLAGQFPCMVKAFAERDRWPVERMQDFLEAQLREILRYAVERVAHYREAWGNAKITPAMLRTFSLCDLPVLPIVRRSDLRLHSESFVARKNLHWPLAWRESTSGSTGEPVVVINTAALQQAYLAAREARSFRWAGTSMRHSRATIGGRIIVPRADSAGPYYRYNVAEKQCYFSAFHISPQNAVEYVAALRRYRPQVLTGYASSYFSLAHMMQSQGLWLDYRPDALILCADGLTPQMKTVISEAFGARAHEEYGSVENAGLATECEAGSLHVNSDFGIVEIVDDEGQPVGPGKEGRIVCTSLLNRVQPLIRYDIGDTGTWSGRPCPCGRAHLPVLAQITGRVEDTVIGPDGREMMRVCSLQDVPHVLASQLVQESLDRIKVRVIATDEFDESDERMIRRIIGTNRLGNIAIDIERVRELERTASGKVRRVIRRAPLPELRRDLEVKG